MIQSVQVQVGRSGARAEFHYEGYSEVGVIAVEEQDGLYLLVDATGGDPRAFESFEVALASFLRMVSEEFLIDADFIDQPIIPQHAMAQASVVDDDFHIMGG